MNNVIYGRKRSGIKKEISAKIESWLETISDENVRTLAGENTIITGGAIASMLLGEQVNDFDVYFRDQKTAVAVAKYYVKSINEYDVEVILEDLDNIRGNTESRVIIRIPSDGLMSYKTPKKDKYRVTFLSENAITLSNKIQIIIRFHGEPHEIHDNYDFAHAKCYWDHGKKILDLPAFAMECMMSRTLHYTGSLYPIASIFRMKKFIERGWRITAGQQLKIMWQISEIDLTDPAVLREQLTGVDLAYMRHLINVMQGLDKDDLNSTYVGKVIDRIFSENEA